MDAVNGNLGEDKILKFRSSDMVTSDNFVNLIWSILRLLHLQILPICRVKEEQILYFTPLPPQKKTFLLAIAYAFWIFSYIFLVLPEQAWNQRVNIALLFFICTMYSQNKNKHSLTPVVPLSPLPTLMVGLLLRWAYGNGMHIFNVVCWFANTWT